MIKGLRRRLFLASTISSMAALTFAAPKGVQVTTDPVNRRVDVTIDGKPFTSYIWPTTIKKPVLYPIVDADGITVTPGAGHWSRAPASALTIPITMDFGSITAT
jgi:hypothetical protein